SEDEAMSAIDSGLRAFYASQSTGAADARALERSGAGLQEVYRRNVFPSMMVSFGSYPTNRGHFTSTGCFRCHDDSHTAAGGPTHGPRGELPHPHNEQPTPA